MENQRMIPHEGVGKPFDRAFKLARKSPWSEFIPSPASFGTWTTVAGASTDCAACLLESEAPEDLGKLVPTLLSYKIAALPRPFPVLIFLCADPTSVLLIPPEEILLASVKRFLG